MQDILGRVIKTGPYAWMTVADKLRLYFTPTEDGCWIWKGRIFSNGYGDFRVFNKSYLAHRAVYELMIGPINAPVLRHSCDVRNCVNPHHLHPGTQRDNARDMISRNRQKWVYGQDTVKSKLSDHDVARIRELAACGMMQKDIQKMFPVSAKQISVIVNYKQRKQNGRR